jgi:hypothetical protein
VGLFSGRENVDSRLSVDEYSAVEEKQSPGLRENLYAATVERLSKVNRGNTVLKLRLVTVKVIEISDLEFGRV